MVAESVLVDNAPLSPALATTTDGADLTAEQGGGGEPKPAGLFLPSCAVEMRRKGWSGYQHRVPLPKEATHHKAKTTLFTDVMRKPLEHREHKHFQKEGEKQHQEQHIVPVPQQGQRLKQPQVWEQKWKKEQKSGDSELLQNVLLSVVNKVEKNSSELEENLLPTSKYEECDKELFIDEEDESNSDSTQEDDGNFTDLIQEKGKELPGTNRRNVSRQEAQLKMEDGKRWLMNSLMVISTTSIISLSSIETSYQSYCHQEQKEPLTTPVLARLIHSLFPNSTKCRLGPRGSQRIHYRSLGWKDDQKKAQQLKATSGNQVITVCDTDSEDARDDTTAGVTTFIIKQGNELDAEITNGNNAQQNIRDELLVNDESSEQVEDEHKTSINQDIQEERKQAKSCVVAGKREIQIQEAFPTEKGERKQEVSTPTEKGERKQEVSTPTEKGVRKQEVSTPTEKEVQKQEVSTSSSQGQTSICQNSDDDELNCENSAKRLSQVLKWISKQGRSDILLRDFAHSASCPDANCRSVCLMFRRVRRHVVAARHSCAVLRIYSALLRLHVSSCNNSECGLPACPALRATQKKRSPIQQEQSAKRRALQMPNGQIRPMNLSFAPRSPAVSLPGSPVNSPPASPTGSSLSQIHYVVLPVLTMPLEEKRGA